MRYAWAIVLGSCLSFGLGLALPWWPSASSPAAPAGVVRAIGGPASASTAGRDAPAPARHDGVIAIGDEILHDASTCLRDRGITVHPRIIRSVEELQRVVLSATARYKVVHVHVSGLDNLVDGHIATALRSVSPGTRVIWSTIRWIPKEWGTYSPEDRINASIRNTVGGAAHGRVLDWRSATSRHPEWTLLDGRPSATGCREYAARIVKLSGLPRRAWAHQT